MPALRDELGRLLAYEEHHRRLVSRLVLIVIATSLVDVIGSVAMYVLEHGAHGTEIKTFGQAVFFTTVQLLTVSSQIKNPVDRRRPGRRRRARGMGSRGRCWIRGSCRKLLSKL